MTGTVGRVAEELPDGKPEREGSSWPGEVVDGTDVTAMNPTGELTAAGVFRRRRGGSNLDREGARAERHLIDAEGREVKQKGSSCQDYWCEPGCGERLFSIHYCMGYHQQIRG